MGGLFTMPATLPPFWGLDGMINHGTQHSLTMQTVPSIQCNFCLLKQAAVNCGNHVDCPGTIISSSLHASARQLLYGWLMLRGNLGARPVAYWGASSEVLLLRCTTDAPRPLFRASPICLMNSELFEWVAVGPHCPRLCVTAVGCTPETAGCFKQPPGGQFVWSYQLETVEGNHKWLTHSASPHNLLTHNILLRCANSLTGSQRKAKKRPIEMPQFPRLGSFHTRALDSGGAQGFAYVVVSDSVQSCCEVCCMRPTHPAIGVLEPAVARWLARWPQ
ncbi:Vitamin D-binding protein [Varanus komodoensis]|nr:Vitamin D-binding protein [Varanus komodoensis]